MSDGRFTRYYDDQRGSGGQILHRRIRKSDLLLDIAPPNVTSNRSDSAG